MEIPNWWESILLVLAAYRLTRLVGWDEFPLAVRLRAWATGEEWQVSTNTTGNAAVPGSPGVTATYRRPILEHFLGCPFCVGLWITLAWWAAWQLWPHGTLVVAAPLALAAGVGLVAKNLDP